MTTDKRIEALEKTLKKSIRSQRIVITTLVLAVVAAVTIAAAPQIRRATFDEITAKKISIVNDAGETKAVLAVIENGGTLRIYNAEGKIRADIAMPTGPVYRIGAGTGERKTFIEKMGKAYNKLIPGEDTTP